MELENIFFLHVRIPQNNDYLSHIEAKRVKYKYVQIYYLFVWFLIEKKLTPCDHHYNVKRSILFKLIHIFQQS
jgi:hypothetical protein